MKGYFNEEEFRQVAETQAKVRSDRSFIPLSLAASVGLLRLPISPEWAHHSLEMEGVLVVV